MRPILLAIALLLLLACQLNSGLQSETSLITCPHCQHKETEVLPTEYCVIAYDCKKCGITLRPEGDDCCVFCTHGTHKCPSKQ